MTDLENRDGPFDLNPSEMIQIMETMGVNISRQEAVAMSSWAYETFRSWRIENLPKPPIQTKPQPTPSKQEKM